MTKGCEEHAVEGKLAYMAKTCCPLAEAIVPGCYPLDCIMRDQREMTNQHNIEMKKSLKKNYEIAKVCPCTGMPKSEAEVFGKVKPQWNEKKCGKRKGDHDHDHD